MILFSSLVRISEPQSQVTFAELVASLCAEGKTVKGYLQELHQR